MHKTSFLHRLDDYICFTPSCPPHILQQNCTHGLNVWRIYASFSSESVNWPRQPDLSQHLATDDSEVKKTTTCAAVESSPVNYLHGLLSRCSAYKAIQRCTAWLLQFKQYWRWKYSSNKMPPRKGPLIEIVLSNVFTPTRKTLDFSRCRRLSRCNACHCASGTVGSLSWSYEWVVQCY